MKIDEGEVSIFESSLFNSNRILLGVRLVGVICSKILLIIREGVEGDEGVLERCCC